MHIKEWNVGDYFISLSDTFKRKKFDIKRILNINKGMLSYDNTTTGSYPQDIRPATQQEIDWHLQDPINNKIITNMPKDYTINNYSIY